MKLTGIFGKGTGRKGDAVFVVSGGEQIVRQYNPNVSNPSTEGQVEQRAKLKLMSQLGAALAPIMGFTKNGLVSARNQFVSKNIGKASFGAGIATVQLEAIDLTGSSLGLPAIEATKDENDRCAVVLGASAPEGVSRVVYAAFQKTDGDKLVLVDKVVISTPGADRTFDGTLDTSSGKYIVYAYGVCDTNEAATARYLNYVAEKTETTAILEISRMVKAGDANLTMSQAVHYSLD